MIRAFFNLTNVIFTSNIAGHHYLDYDFEDDDDAFDDDNVINLMMMTMISIRAFFNMTNVIFTSNGRGTLDGAGDAWLNFCHTSNIIVKSVINVNNVIITII